MTNQESSYKIGAIFGTGRSGSTWLGSIVSSHPDVAYRFEPFHRLKKTDAKVAEAFELIDSDSFSSKDLITVYQALLPAHPELEKPPFFQKNYGMKLPVGRVLTWPIAKKNKLVQRIFSYIYTPTNTPLLVFKEVDYSNMMCQLIAKTETPVVYLVRHPCAVISSLLEGQKNALMPSQRRSVLKNLLLEYEPALAEEYGDKIEGLTVPEQEALLWLIDNNQGIRASWNNDQALIVIYEQLTQQPLLVGEQVLNHFGLSMTPQTISFIEESTGNSKEKSKDAFARGDGMVNSYFSVYRDPKVSRESWKEKMSKEDQTKIMDIVKNVDTFSFIAKQGFWD